MIWKAALPGPRLVDIRQRPLKETIGEWETRTGEKWPEMMGSLKEEQEEEEEDSDANILYTESEDEGEDDKSAKNSSDDEDAEPELQGSIWDGDEIEHNRNGMRLEMGIAIHPHGYDTVSYKKANMLGIFSETTAPNILCVCRESRDVVLESYNPAFYCTGSFPQTYYNFSIDTLYLRYDTFSHYFSKDGLGSISLDLEYRSRIEDIENLRKVQRLAILFDEASQDPPEVDLASIFGTFGGVKDFSIVLKDFTKHTDLTTYVSEHDNSADLSGLTLYAPFDVAIAIRDLYTLIRYNANSRAPPLFRDTPSLNYQRLDMEKLMEYQTADCEEGEHPWELPEIHQRSVVPRRLREEFKYASKLARADSTRKRFVP